MPTSASNSSGPANGRSRWGSKSTSSLMSQECFCNPPDRAHYRARGEPQCGLGRVAQK